MMKLLYSVIFILGIIQLILIAESIPIGSNSTSLKRSQLVNFYVDEINLLSAEICIKFHDISEQILKDKTVIKAKTPALQEFKRNITEFLEIYTSYARYGLTKELHLMFFDTILSYYHEPTADKDSQYIFQLIEELGCDEILVQFESNFIEFARNKFIPKFEEFEQQVPEIERQQWQKLFSWAEEMKGCRTYTCFYNSFQQFDYVILTPAERISGYINQQIDELNVVYANSATRIGEGVLSNNKFPQLHSNVQQLVEDNINEYISEYEATNDTTELHNLLRNFCEILLKFNYSSDMSEEDRQLLEEIADEAGLAKYASYYYEMFDDFIEHGLIQRLEYLNQEENFKDSPWLDYIERFRTVTSYEDRVSLLTALRNTVKKM